MFVSVSFYQGCFFGKDVSNVYVMKPTMNAIFFMRRMSAHFVSETIPMRMLYDWALFLKHYSNEVVWDHVMPLYEKSSMMRFVGIIMTILRTYLECESPACPVALVKLSDAEMVWESIIDPPQKDPYDKFTLRYYLFEARTFFANRWKHKLVYPDESFVIVFFKYVKLGLSMMIKRH